METAGAERDGVTRKRAEAELRERQVKVDRQGWRKPAPLTFGDYSRTWFEEGKKRRQWKPRTVTAYRDALVRLGVGFDGNRDDGIAATRLAASARVTSPSTSALALGDFSAKTVQLNLGVLHDLLKTARREELIDSNAAEGVEWPKVERKRWRILEPAEVQRVARAFTDERARLTFLTLMLTGVRRFELQALRWRDVDLITNVLRVRESKSEEGERSIALSPTLSEALWQHRRATRYQGDDELVFCHLPPEERPQARPGLVRRRVSDGARRGWDHGLRPAVPRRPPRLPHERRRRGRTAARADGPRRPPQHDHHEPVRAPGGRNVPGCGARARRPAARG